MRYGGVCKKARVVSKPASFASSSLATMPIPTTTIPAGTRVRSAKRTPVTEYGARLQGNKHESDAPEIKYIIAARMQQYYLNKSEL